MEKEIIPMSQALDFSDMPSWYVLCTNGLCPLQGSCLRYQAGSRVPETLEVATCVMPKAFKDGKCRWYDKRKVVVWAAGFTHLYDCVMKKDYTSMRKGITSYLHGPKMYYEYMRGERSLSPEQQEWINNFVKSYGYDWEVPYDRYYEGYEYHHVTPSNNKVVSESTENI
jgi:hypothetical protein